LLKAGSVLIYSEPLPLCVCVFQLKGVVADVEQINASEGKKVAEVYELEKTLDHKAVDLLKRKIDIMKNDTDIKVRRRPSS
jgi:hypothetical protein